MFKSNPQSRECKTVILGVTGSIAAYKALEIVRELKTRGHRVQVVMTRAATRLVQPLSFTTLCGSEAVTSLFPRDPHRGTEHIDLAQAAELVLIAPATANCIGKLAGGIADDMLTTVALAVRCPVLVAPAMNVRMWENPIVQRNVATLRGLGYHFVEPEEGPLACGEYGTGRLARISRIVDAAQTLLGRGGELEGKCVLVTAGRTEEPLDPVRYLSNRSSGKMGYALAEEAQARGAEVILVSGPSALPVPGGVEVLRVRTAEEMKKAVLANLSRVAILFMAAAVADFRPKQVRRSKIKKDQLEPRLDLEKTPDILSLVAKRKRKGTTVIGFALETQDLLRNARKKLTEKDLDLIVINDPTVKGASFEVDTNVVTVLDRRGKKQAWPILPKREVARRLLDMVVTLQR